MAQFINVQKKSSDVLVYCSAGLLFIFFTFGVAKQCLSPLSFTSFSRAT